ncbi:MAG: hypothetical protein WD398_05290 [Cyclobacteriaceae bacterium]
MKFKFAFQFLSLLFAMACTEVKKEEIDEKMYQTTFRILETEDEHFYDRNISSYHWAMHGFGLSKEVLEKVYPSNARKILGLTNSPQ